MKLSYWTLGMPPWSGIELAQRALEFGYKGVDLRCTAALNGSPSDHGNLSIETPETQLDSTRQIFASAGVELPCIICYTGGGHFGKAVVDWDELLLEVQQHALVAERIGSPRIRLTVGRPASSELWDEYLLNLGKTALQALGSTPNVSAVFENHVGSASAEQLFAMVERLGDDRLGVVFSPDHCVVMQEDPVALAEQHWPAIQQVSFSDRKVVQEDLGRFDGRYYHVRYETCWNGEGIVPAAKLFETLARSGYTGYVALKWEKSERFGHELPPGEQALPHFVQFMRSFGVVD